MKRTLLTMLMVLTLLFAGCRSMRGGGIDWYSGPAELKQVIQDDINAAIHHLQIELGRPLKWRWDKDTIKVSVIAPAGHHNSKPFIISPGGDKCYGYYLNGAIVIPQGYKPGTIIHECGHGVLRANGYPDILAHHGIAPKFFKHFSGNH